MEQFAAMVGVLLSIMEGFGMWQTPHALVNEAGGARGGSRGLGGEVGGAAAGVGGLGRGVENDEGRTRGLGRGVGVERDRKEPGQRAGERGARRPVDGQGGNGEGARRAGDQARRTDIPSGISLEEVSSSAPRERSEDRFEGGRNRSKGMAP